MNKDTAVRYVVDAQGQPQGVFLEQEMWEHVCKHVLSVLDKLYPSEVEIAEPMGDLQLLGEVLGPSLRAPYGCGL